MSRTIAGMMITTEDTVNIAFASPESLPSCEEKIPIQARTITSIVNGVKNSKAFFCISGKIIANIPNNNQTSYKMKASCESEYLTG